MRLNHPSLVLASLAAVGAACSVLENPNDINHEEPAPGADAQVGQPAADAGVDAGPSCSPASKMQLSCSFVTLQVGTGPVSTPVLGSTVDGWSWLSPWPHGNSINALWLQPAGSGSYEGSVWEAGRLGTLVWGGDTPSNVYVWQAKERSELTAIWGSDDSNVWAVGRGGAVFYKGGTNWDALYLTTADLNGVWGDGQGVWFVGNGGVILRYKGGQLEQLNCGLDQNLYAIGGRGADDVFIAGAGGLVLHLDANAQGTALTVPDVGDLTALDLSQSGLPQAFFASSSGQVVRLVDGCAPGELNSCGNVNPLRGIAIRNEHSVVAVGDSLTVLDVVDGACHTVSAPIDFSPAPAPSLRAVRHYQGTSYAGAQNPTWIAGEQGILFEYDGSTLHKQWASESGDHDLQGAWLRSGSEAWFAGDLGALACYGANCENDPPDTSPRSALGTSNYRAMAGWANGVVVAGNDVMVLDNNGQAGGVYYAQPVSGSGALEFGSVAAFANGTFLAISQSPVTCGIGTCTAWLGDATQPGTALKGMPIVATAGSLSMRSVCARGSTFYVAGGSGAFGSCTTAGCMGQQVNNGNDNFKALACGPTSALFAVATGKKAFRAGTTTAATWTQASPPSVDELNGIWAQDENHAWVVGDNGRIDALTFSGSSLAESSRDSGTDRRLLGISGVDNGDGSYEMFVVGQGGAVLHKHLGP